MKALLINGSPRVNGTTKRALLEIEKPLRSEGFDCEIADVKSDVTGCRACGYCKKAGKCVINDQVNLLLPKFEEADVMIIGSPVYYASPNGTLISLLDRLFHSASFDKRMKVGAAVVVARRGGLTATFDVINKYFTISGMPIASSRYWNQLHGRNATEAEGDAEGLATLRELGRNAAFLAKSIKLGKEAYGMPKQENPILTNFIR